jgi:hypothetical protein
MPSNNPACSSNGELLPPTGEGATLPVPCQRSVHRIAELTLIENRRAASRRDAPAETA